MWIWCQCSNKLCQMKILNFLGCIFISCPLFLNSCSPHSRNYIYSSPVLNFFVGYFFPFFIINKSDVFVKKKCIVYCLFTFCLIFLILNWKNPSAVASRSSCGGGQRHFPIRTVLALDHIKSELAGFFKIWALDHIKITRILFWYYYCCTKRNFNILLH